MHTPVSSLSPRRSHQAGLSLIELMIAVLLGLLVVAAGMGLLLSNRKTYGTTQGLSRIQENQRLAFDMLSADIRAAGDFPCAALTRPGRLVAQVDKHLYPNGNLRQWDNALEIKRAGIRPYALEDETQYELTIYTGSSWQKHYLDPAESMGYRYAVISHDSPEGPIKIKDATSIRQNKSFKEDLVICNADRAVVFHASEVTDTHEIYHQAGTVGDLVNAERVHSNCGTAFVYDPAKRTEFRAALDQGKCNQEVSSPGGNNRYCFGPDAKTGEKGCDRVGNSQAFVVPIVHSQITWKIYSNLGGRPGQMLTRTTENSAEEITDGIRSLEFKYRLYGESVYKTAAEIDPNYNKKVSTTVGGEEYAYNPIWGRVDSVYIKMEFEAPESSGLSKSDTRGTDGNPLSRTLEGYVMIRNRLRNQPDGG